MVVLFFLLSPVLVELVDFNSCVALLKQVKSLCVTRKQTYLSCTERRVREKKNLAQTHTHRHYLIDFTEAAPAQQVQQQVPLIQGRMVFKSV